MSFLTQYRERLHFKKAEQGKQNQKKVNNIFTGLGKVGILINATDSKNVDQAMAYVKELQKQAGSITILGYSEVNEIKTERSFDCFCKKDIDWIWLPKGEVINRFQQQQYDLLINCCQTDCFPLEYIAVSVHANYKIGALTDYPNNYDLMIESKNLEGYFKQVKFFLDKFSS
jgi:hypothetical protein